jgi:hypothetical protein
VENPPSPAASPDNDVAAAESLGKGTAPVTTQAAPAEQLEIEVVNAPVGRQPAPKLPEPLFPAAVPPAANAEQTKTLQTAEAADANVPHPQAAQSGVTIVARVAPEAVDPRAALSQRILRFRQPEPVPFSKLLVQVEELAGVPLRYEKDVLSAETLKTPVTLDLSMTTVGDILTALLRQVGLAHEVDKDGIRLRIAD